MISQQPSQQAPQTPQQASQQALQQEDWLCGWIWLLLSTWEVLFTGGLQEEEMGTTYEEEVGGTYEEVDGTYKEEVGGASEEVDGAYKEDERNDSGVLFVTCAALLLSTGEGI